MPCWPDVREALLPWLVGPFKEVTIILVVVGLMLWAPRIRWLWLRVTLRVIGGAVALFVFVVVIFALLLNSGNTKPIYRTESSPTGLHQATFMYEGGFLGRDFTNVRITTKGCCQHFTAYEYWGPSDGTGTELTWIDDSHLQIEYHSDPKRTQNCNTQAGDVIIICRPQTWGSR